MRSARRTAAFLAGALILSAVVVFIYRDATRSYFFNDDFQWLQGARAFAFANLLHLERYNHFYRPVIEIYFWAGRHLFGCDAFSFHLASIGIHLVNVLLLYLLARTLTPGPHATMFAALAALFFAVQPGHAQAVAWVGSITDLLPALWYLLALWMHLLFLRQRRIAFYLIALAAFAACLLTHESSATLIVMMIAVEWTINAERSTFRIPVSTLLRYLPFALLLAGYLVIAYIVNSRSYLVTEGHYRVGWHAVTHTLDYLITLPVGLRGLVWQVVFAAGCVALVAFGTPRVRLFTVWMLVTIAPASLFTWGNVSRYLYLPAAGFAMLLAEAILAGERFAARKMPPRAARTIAVAVALVLAVRFAAFAQKVPSGFRDWTRPYERFVAAVRRASPAPRQGEIVYVDPPDVENVPVAYRDPAAEVASCGADVHVVVR